MAMCCASLAQFGIRSKMDMQLRKKKKKIKGIHH